MQKTLLDTDPFPKTLHLIHCYSECETTAFFFLVTSHCVNCIHLRCDYVSFGKYMYFNFKKLNSVRSDLLNKSTVNLLYRATYAWIQLR